MDEKTTKELAAIASVLREADGLANAVTAREIARRLKRRLSYERRVRELIADHPEYFWNQGLLLVAKAGHGFFCGNDITELQHCRDYLILMRQTFTDKLNALDRLTRQHGIRLL